MDADQIIKLVEVLAWPLTSLVIASVFRAPTAMLISRINAIEAGGIRTEFSSEMRELSQIVQDGERPSTRLTYDSKGAQLQRLAKYSPNGAVVDAWREVELATISAALHNNLDVRGNKGRVSGNAAVKSLREHGLVSDSTYEVYLKLKDLRNKAAHSADNIESVDAQEYSLAALDLAAKLREMRSQTS